MTSVRPNPEPKLPPDWLIGIVIAILITSVLSILRNFLDSSKYESAIQSYERKDCGAAIEQFNQIIYAFRLIDVGDYVSFAKEKKAECEFFQNALSAQRNGKFELALLYYAKVAVYDDSVLFEPVQKKLRELFQKAKVTSLATSQSCSRLGVLSQQNLLPKSDPKLPSLYSECGKLYEAQKDYSKASSTYEEFLKKYPDHSMTKNIKQSLAQTTIADVRGRGAQKIESPGRIGTTVDGSTVVEIQNTSPGKMQITFSGATPKFEKLQSCRDCVTYVNSPPKLCPQKGPVGRYTLEPGQYDIAVKFTADNGNPVKPWVGNWSLEAGAKYKSCFFIIRDPVDEPQKKE